MLKPAVTLLLWLALAVLLVLNNLVGDTVIAAATGPRLAEWYKLAVPLPYMLLLAIIHAADH